MANFLSADSTTTSSQTTGKALWWVMITLLQLHGKRSTSKESSPGNNLLQILGRKPFWSDAKRINGNILHTTSPDVWGKGSQSIPKGYSWQIATEEAAGGFGRFNRGTGEFVLFWHWLNVMAKKEENGPPGLFPDSRFCWQFLLYNVHFIHWFAWPGKVWAFSVGKIWNADKGTLWNSTCFSLVWLVACCSPTGFVSLQSGIGHFAKLIQCLLKKPYLAASVTCRPVLAKYGEVTARSKWKQKLFVQLTVKTA